MLLKPSTILLATLVSAALVAAEPPPSSTAFFPATGNASDTQPSQVPLDPTADPPQAQVVPVLRDYDRFQDKTSVRVEGIRPTVTKGESRLFLTVTCSADGSAIATKPAKVKVEVLAVSDAYQYADLKDGLQLIFLLTGAPTTAPAANVPVPRAMPAGVGEATPGQAPGNVRRVRVPARFQKAGMTKDRNPKTLESFVAIVDADVLVQMATAPGVEGQLGGAEFKLGTMEQLSLRRLAEQVKLLEPLPEPDAAALDRALANGPVRADAVALHLAQAKVDGLQEAVDRLNVARLEKLEATKEYQTAEKAALELEAKKDETPAGPQRAEISQHWLEARAKVSLMKSSALLDDTELATAKRDLGDAQTALHNLQRAAGGGNEVRNAQR